MSGKTDAWMPLWIGAYLADTQHLARDEHGGYLLLLMAYWRASGPLPDDDKRLAAIAKATPKEWKELRATLAEFFTVADGFWTHKRVEQELNSSLERKEKAGSKAKTAAEARWKDHRKDAPSIAPSTPQAVHEECPTPTPSSVLRPEEKARKRAAPDMPRPDDVAEQVWGDWVQLRKKRGSTVSLTAIAEARTEASKAGLNLERFLSVWCARGSTGLQADWLKPHERGPAQQASGETAYQRSMRERVEAFAPGVAARAPGQQRPLTIIEEAPYVPAIASR